MAETVGKQGKLLAIIGNIGVGKTTLLVTLQRAGGFVPALEEPESRPYQKAFADNLTRYAFPNQVDFLLFRAEQEVALRQSGRIGIFDGGLDQDFEVFTRHFHQKGYLTQAEFRICERLYGFIRELIPLPDLYLYLQASLPAIERRLTRRRRTLEITNIEDLRDLDVLLKDWVGRLGDASVLKVDAETDSFCSPPRITALLEEIGERLDLEP